MTRKMKVFAWDFHGTLEQGVEVGFWHILKQIALRRKIAENFTLSEVRKLYGTSIGSYLKHFFPEANDNEIKQMMAEVVEIQTHGHLKKYVTAAPGSIEILTKVRKAGHKNIVLSNSHPEHINPLIKIVRLEHLIEEVYAIDRHYTHKKIDPVREKTKVLKKLIKINKLKNGDLITIGDRATDIEAGIAAGATTYQFLRKGFPVDKTGADYKIYDFAEISREIY